MTRYLVSAAVVGIIAGAGLGADLRSGPQPGDPVVPFSPLNVNGPAAGEKQCPVWMMGNPPVAAVFAREITPGLTSLVKKLDKAAAKHSDCKMGAWVVLLTDDDKMEGKLKELADQEKLKKVVLAVDSPAGPPKYKLAKDADLTVILYEHKTVKKNFAFEKGKITEKDAEAILAAVDEIASKKEKGSD